jgi:signal transduction histidine kinase
MPDGTVVGAVDSAEDAAVAVDNRLVTGVGRRLVLWAAGTTLVVLIALGVALYVSVAQSLASTGTRQLEARAASLRGLIDGTGGRQPGDNDVGVIFGGGTSGTFALILDANGQPILPRTLPPTSGLPDAASLAAAKTASQDDVRLGTVNRTPVRILTTAVQSNVGTVYLQIYQDRTAEDRTLTVLLTTLLVGGVIVLLAAAAVGVVYSRRALVPIRESLANQRRALRRQREFAADASHELRTPLTVVRASVEYLRRHGEQPVSQVADALDDIDAEVGHLTSLVEELLLLARSDSGAAAIEHVPTDLGDIATEAASSLVAPAAQRGVRIVVDPEPAPMLGDSARLRQLVVILVDNAVAHSPRGGTVTVTVRRDGGHLRLDVEDEGPGIRDEDLPHVFERFWRGAGAPPGGAGLGLAIAEWIVSAHGGTITAANREPHGARFSAELSPGG